MKTFMSVVMTMLLAFVGSACMENKNGKLGSGKSEPPEIADRQTDMMPIANTYYTLYPNDIYPRDPSHPGPAELNTSIAWSQANEFVYRTALRRLCQLPASATGPEEDGYMVSFERIGG